MTNKLPPLADKFIVMQVDLENQVMIQAQLGYNQDSGEDATDAAELLKEATGNDYVVMRVTQVWYAATFEFETDTMVIQ